MYKKLLSMLLFVGIMLGCFSIEVFAADHVVWDTETQTGPVIVTNDGLTAELGFQGKSNSIRTNVGRKTGKWYWEIDIETDENSVRTHLYIGATCYNSSPYNYYDTATGHIHYSGSKSEPTNTKAYSGDTLGLAMDCTSMKFRVYLNGEFLREGSLFKLTTHTDTFYPSVQGMMQDDLKVWITANFGDSAFKYDIPAGYRPYNGGTPIPPEPPVDPPIDPPEPKNNMLSVLLEEYETARLIVTDRLTDNTNYLWSSSDEEVATVDDNGRVTAIAPGFAMITAESPDGEYTDSIPVWVVPKGAAGERLAVYLDPGEEQWLYLNDDYDNIEWESMEPEIVEVDEMGKLKALKKGLAIVKATYEDETYLIYVRVG